MTSASGTDSNVEKTIAQGGTHVKLEDPANDANKIKGEVLVLDGARSWVVCGANFVILFLSAVFGRLLSMCFLDLVNEFESTITTTSLSFTFHLLTLSFSSILGTSVVIPITGVRAAAVTGTLLSGICTMCMGLATNIPMFIFFMAVKGICVGISLVPAISMISQYFEKRRSLATALANCGISAGSMGSPPLIKFLLERFGLRGTFVIIGALELNAVAVSMLLIPKSHYSAVISSKDANPNSDKLLENNTTDPENQKDTTSSAAKQERMPSIKNAQKVPGVIISNADNTQASTLWLANASSSFSPSPEMFISTPTMNTPSVETQYGKVRQDKYQLSRKRSVSESGGGSQKHTIELLDTTSSYEKINIDQKQSLNCKANRYGIDTSDDVSSQQSIPMIAIHIEDNDSGLDIDTGETGKNGHNDKSDQIQTKNNSLFTIHSSPQRYGGSRSSAFRGASHDNNHKSTSVRQRIRSNGGEEFRMSSWSIVSSINSEMHVDVEACALENERRRQQQQQQQQRQQQQQQQEETNKGSTAMIPGVGETENRQQPVVPPSLALKILAALQNAFNVSLLRLWTARLLMLSSITGTLGHYPPTYLPTIALKQGMTVDQVSVLLTISGSVDLASRIFLGFLSDLHIMKNSHIVVIAQISLGTVCYFIGFIQTFELFIFLSVVIGMFGCARQNLITLVIIEFVGPTRFLKMLGSLAMVGTLSLAIHHPLLNSMLEGTGSFSVPFYYVGLALYASTVCLLLGPLLKRFDDRKDSSSSTSSNES